MKGVGEFEADDVSGQGLAVNRGLDLIPMLAGVGGMKEHTGRASNPNIGIIGRKGAKNDIAGYRNCLPGFAGIERMLHRAVRERVQRNRASAGRVWLIAVWAIAVLAVDLSWSLSELLFSWSVVARRKPLKQSRRMRRPLS